MRDKPKTRMTARGENAYWSHRTYRAYVWDPLPQYAKQSQFGGPSGQWPVIRGSWLGKCETKPLSAFLDQKRRVRGKTEPIGPGLGTSRGGYQWSVGSGQWTPKTSKQSQSARGLAAPGKHQVRSSKCETNPISVFLGQKRRFRGETKPIRGMRASASVGAGISEGVKMSVR